MHKLMMALGLTALLAACGGGKGFDEILKKGKSFKDATCACKDLACAEKVEADMDAWMEKAVKDFKGKPSKAQDEAWDKLEDEMKGCKVKLETAANDAKAAEGLAKMKGYKDQMCACADAACADKVTKDMADWMQGPGKELASVKPSPELEKQAEALGEEMSKCMQKAMTPPVDPTAAPADPAAAPADPAAPAPTN